MMQFDSSPDRKGWGYFMMIFMGIAGFVVIVLPFSVKPKSSVLALVITGLVLIALGVLFYLESLRTSVLIDNHSITFKSAFSSRSILLDEIMGYRLAESAREGQLFVLVTNRQSYRLPTGLEGYDDLVAWFKARFPDLEAVNYKESAENMLQDQRFGVTKMERLVKLSHAILTSLVARVVTMLLVVLDIVLVLPVHLPLMITVFILPWALIASILYFKGMLKLYRGKGDANPAAGMVLWVSSAIVVTNTWMNFDLYYFNLRTVVILVAMTCTIAAIWIFCCRNAIMMELQRSSLIAGMIAAAFAYSYGLLVYTNCYRDSRVQQVRRMSVEAKYISYGSKSETYSVMLAPWADDFSTKKLKVNETIYKNLKDDDTVNVYIWKGRWDIPWYKVNFEEITRK